MCKDGLLGHTSEKAQDGKGRSGSEDMFGPLGVHALEHIHGNPRLLSLNKETGTKHRIEICTTMGTFAAFYTMQRLCATCPALC